MTDGPTAIAPDDPDIVVRSAAVPLRPNSSRLVLLAGNARIVADCPRPLHEAGDAFRGVVLTPTDPVRPLLTWTRRRGRLTGHTLNADAGAQQYADTRYAEHVAPGSGRISTWTTGRRSGCPIPLT